MDSQAVITEKTDQEETPGNNFQSQVNPDNFAGESDADKLLK